MGKRSFSIILGLALVAGLFGAAPAAAQTAVPANVNIEDVSGDSNGLNDQGFGGFCVQSPACVPETGDNSGGVSIGAADILKVWFTNTTTSVSAHILTTFPPPNNTPGFGLIYRVILNDRCTYLQGFVPSRTYVGAQKANVREFCGESGTTEGGEITVEALGDGTGITTLTYPFGLHPALVAGATLATPEATATVATGTDSPALYFPILDGTPVGTDYVITTGGGEPVVEPEPEPEPPGKDDPPGKGKKKGCKKGKGKGKKKGACPGKKEGKPEPPADECAAYVPGEMGAEAETSIVTDEATEEAPVEVDVPVGPAFGRLNSSVDSSTRMKLNVQVDSDAAESGLFARLEGAPGDDPDLYAYWPSGDQAAVVGGFNPLLPAGPLPNPTNNNIITSLNGQGGGGHSEFTAEQIDGLRTADCQGWTLDLVNWAGRGAYTLTLWLGEIQNDPAAPAGGGDEALSVFYRLMRL